MTREQIYKKEQIREYDRLRRFNAYGKGRRMIYIDALEKDEFGENELDRLGVFSDRGKGAMAIRNFDEDAADKLRAAFLKINSLEREIVKKVIQNGHQNRERTIRWIEKNQLHRRYPLRKRFKGNARLSAIGISEKCGTSKKN